MKTIETIKFSNAAKLAIKEIFDKKKTDTTGIEYAKIVVQKTVSRNGIKIPSDVFKITEAALRAATVEPEWLELLLVATRELSDVLSNQKENQQIKELCKKSKSKRTKSKK